MGWLSRIFRIDLIILTSIDSVSKADRKQSGGKSYRTHPTGAY
jgi:hypothetical protein